VSVDKKAQRSQVIPLFKKLRRENLLTGGILVDLGCGDGILSEEFFEAGYHTILVDADAARLSAADARFRRVRPTGYQLVHEMIQRFSLPDDIGGVIISNVLPYVKSRRAARSIVRRSYAAIGPRGFVYCSLFGAADEWAAKEDTSMDFYSRQEALGLLEVAPYFVSEDSGTGITTAGDFKRWHIFQMLYVKLSPHH
jgi:SAM-dependent methyltransferase